MNMAHRLADFGARRGLIAFLGTLCGLASAAWLSASPAIIG
ncbi:MAG: hypothetical protein JWM38_1477 [Sphingomonas bacterium]|nr:hypothetical protein [Sphingomonas bacterium]MDB5718050.1 hypothetical protein [Sphingomonas bacterium]